MRHILALMRRDGRRAYANAVTIVVMAGIIAVPSFYAWFNIAGSWDPYGNTHNLKVAVANADAGYDGELVPIHVNLGERVVGTLVQSDSIGYVPASRDEALEGVRSGTYYAAIVIPEDFSSHLMGAFSSDPEQAQVSFVQNEKANAIAQIVTDKAGTAVSRDIEEAFVSATTDVGAAAASDLARALDDDDVLAVASRLDDGLAAAAQGLRSTADNARSYADLAASTQALLASSSTMFEGTADPLASAGDALAAGADGIDGVADGIGDATESVAGALDDANGELAGVESALDGAFSAAGAQTDALVSALGDAQGTVDDAQGRLVNLITSVNGQVAAAERLAGLLPEGSAGEAAVRNVASTLRGIAGNLQDLADGLSELSGGLKTTADDLAQGKTDTQAAREKLEALVADARAGIDAARDAYTSSARDALSDIEAGARDAAATIDGLDANVASTGAAVAEAGGAAAQGLGNASASLVSAGDILEKTAEGIDETRDRLHDALASSDLAQIRQILAASPASLASFIARPVSLDREAIFPVDNNGSAMTPFYTTLSIWIGGVVLAALVRALPSKRALAETGCTPTEAYLGRLALFAGTALLQTALICAGNLLYLEVQCAHPALFLIAAAVASFVFVNIIYALTASFGDVGKAIAVALMVLQVAGSGGTFPAQMLPAGFQALYNWLPFVHVENALRAAMFGTWGADFWMELGLVCAYLVPALLLGLVLRRPVERLTEWMEEQLESTRVM